MDKSQRRSKVLSEMDNAQRSETFFSEKMPLLLERIRRTGSIHAALMMQDAGDSLTAADLAGLTHVALRERTIERTPFSLAHLDPDIRLYAQGLKGHYLALLQKSQDDASLLASQPDETAFQVAAQNLVAALSELREDADAELDELNAGGDRLGARDSQGMRDMYDLRIGAIGRMLELRIEAEHVRRSFDDPRELGPAEQQVKDLAEAASFAPRLAVTANDTTTMEEQQPYDLKDALARYSSLMNQHQQGARGRTV